MDGERTAGGWFAITNLDALKLARLTGGAARVALALGAHTNGQGQCWPSVARLAALTSLSPRAVQYALRELEAAGAVQTTPGRGRGHVSRYRLQVGPAKGAGRCTLPRDRTPEKVQGSPPKRCTTVHPEQDIERQQQLKTAAALLEREGFNGQSARLAQAGIAKVREAIQVADHLESAGRLHKRSGFIHAYIVRGYSPPASMVRARCHAPHDAYQQLEEEFASIPSSARWRLTAIITGSDAAEPFTMGQDNKRKAIELWRQERQEVAA